MYHNLYLINTLKLNSTFDIFVSHQLVSIEKRKNSI